MARAFTPKVITANHLLEGDVVYMTDTGDWARLMSEAVLLTDEADADVRLLEAQQQVDVVVGVYLADAIANEDGVPTPTHFREEFRRTGPGNYFHGKQAEA